jgi:hypothetical protein
MLDKLKLYNQNKIDVFRFFKNVISGIAGGDMHLKAIGD